MLDVQSFCLSRLKDGSRYEKMVAKLGTRRTRPEISSISRSDFKELDSFYLDLDPVAACLSGVAKMAALLRLMRNL